MLRVLWRADGEALTGREVARRADLSHTAALGALHALREQDIVWTASDRSGTRFRLNRTHSLVAEGLMPLLDVEVRSEERLLEHVMGAIPDAISIIVFGSAARASDGPESDLDVLVIVPDGVEPEAAEEALVPVEFYAREGKLLDPHVHRLADVLAAMRAGVGFLAEATSSGRVLWGESPASLVRTTRVAG
ncbi:MAG TPA: nucleotidyltransferase domain-containing protein [Actinomycetota bacterium]